MTTEYKAAEETAVHPFETESPVVVEGSTQKSQGFMSRAVESFKRADFQNLPPAALDAHLPHVGDTSNLQRKLKGRHLQMIAIGGAIGAGLFIGSGKALSTGGPGALVLDFGIIGVMLFCTINALGELATLFPVQGIPTEN
jgi:amino acid transporter